MACRAGRGQGTHSEAIDQLDREREPEATDVEQRSRGRPKLYARVIQPAAGARFGRAFRPKRRSVCGSPDHNKRWHDEKVAMEKKYPDSTRCSFCGEVGHNQRSCPKKLDKPSGYGYAYGYAYGHGYGERYGRGDSGRGEAAAEERPAVPVRRPRDKAKELEAAELWLRSRARCPEDSRVSIKSACASGWDTAGGTRRTCTTGRRLSWRRAG